MRRALVFFGLIPLALAGQALGQDRSADEQEIRLVVIRQQMQDWASDGDKSEAEAKTPSEKAIARELNFKIFFVSINGRNPGEDFIKRLSDIPRVVKKVSGSQQSHENRSPIVDSGTHQRGIIFSADRIRWKTAKSVSVEAGYYCDRLCADGETFYLRKEGGVWLIKKIRMNWIS